MVLLIMLIMTANHDGLDDFYENNGDCDGNSPMMLTVNLSDDNDDAKPAEHRNKTVKSLSQSARQCTQCTQGCTEVHRTLTIHNIRRRRKRLRRVKK